MPYQQFNLGPYSNWDFSRSIMRPPPGAGGTATAFPPNVGAPAPGTRFNPTPRPGSYNPDYGGVPGALTPPDPFGDLAGVLPNLPQSNQALSSDILAQLHGDLSPDTVSGIENDAARFGISSGVGPDIINRRKIRSLSLTREDQINKGIGNFLNSLAGVSKTQTLSPELQAEIANRNATFGAAPVPADAASALESTFRRNSGFGGGGGGGAITYSGMGGPRRPTAPLQEPNFFWSGDTHGTRVGELADTGWGGNLFGAPTASQLGNEYDPLANFYGEGDNIDYGGDWQFGVPAAPRFGANQYDPLADYSGIDSSNIDFGAPD